MNKTNTKGGRPPGKIKTAKIEVVIEPTLKEDFMNLMHSEGKSASVEIGNWIRNYMKNAIPFGEISEKNR